MTIINYAPQKNGRIPNFYSVKLSHVSMIRMITFQIETTYYAVEKVHIAKNYQYDFLKLTLFQGFQKYTKVEW